MYVFGTGNDHSSIHHLRQERDMENKHFIEFFGLRQSSSLFTAGLDECTTIIAIVPPPTLSLGARADKVGRWTKVQELIKWEDGRRCKSCLKQASASLCRPWRAFQPLGFPPPQLFTFIVVIAIVIVITIVVIVVVVQFQFQFQFQIFYF